ncbi:hypothetical protein [Paenibacillus sp. FSL K6-1558]
MQTSSESTARILHIVYAYLITYVFISGAVLAARQPYEDYIQQQERA